MTLDDLPQRIRDKTQLRANARGSFCWIYTGCRNNSGYGKVRWKGRLVYMHRLAYALAHGRVPSGKIVCHQCDTPECFNPECLQAGTHSTNLKQRWKRGSKKRAAKEIEA
jgi:hypothetical protein